MLEQPDSLVALVAQEATNAVLSVVNVRASRELAEQLAADRAHAVLLREKLFVVFERDVILPAKPRVKHAIRVRSVPGLGVLVRAGLAPLASGHLSALANVDRLDAALRAQGNDGR